MPPEPSSQCRKAAGAPPPPFSTPHGDGCLEQQPTAGGLDTHAPPLPLPATAPTPGSNILPPLPAPTTRAPQDQRTGIGRGKKELTGWSERNQPVSHCSPSPAALPAVLHQPSTRSLETKLRTDRVALATFAAGTYRESASAPPNNDNSTVPPHHRTTTHSLNKPTHTGCVGPAAAKYCLLITSCGPPTATRRAPPRATRY